MFKSARGTVDRVQGIAHTGSKVPQHRLERPVKRLRVGSDDPHPAFDEVFECIHSETPAHRRIARIAGEMVLGAGAQQDDVTGSKAVAGGCECTHQLRPVDCRRARSFGHVEDHAATGAPLQRDVGDGQRSPTGTLGSEPPGRLEMRARPGRRRHLVPPAAGLDLADRDAKMLRPLPLSPGGAVVDDFGLLGLHGEPCGSAGSGRGRRRLRGRTAGRGTRGSGSTHRCRPRP